MMIFRRLTSLIAACVAIFAILLLSGAPIISQHLRPQETRTVTSYDGDAHSVHSAMAMHGMAHSAMSAMSAMNEAPPRVATHHQHNAPGDDYACGYCELLVHVPVFLWVFIPVLLFIPLARRKAIHLTTTTRYLRLSAAFHCPRAPPFFWFFC